MSPLQFFLESVICSLNLRITIRHLLHLSCEDNSSSYDFPSYQGFWKQSSTARKTFDSAKLFVLLSTKKKSAAFTTGFGGYIKWMVTCKNYLLSHSLLFSNRTKLVLSCGISILPAGSNHHKISKRRKNFLDNPIFANNLTNGESIYAMVLFKYIHMAN